MASLCVDVGNSIGIYDAFQERKRQINHYKSRLLSTKKQAKRPPEASGPQTTTTGTTTGTTTTTTTTRTASNLIGVGESCKEDKQMVLMIAPPLENARQQCNMQVRVPFARLVIANDDDDDDECESIRLQELSALREHNEKEQQMIIKKSKREAPIESPERTTGGCRPAGKVSEPRELSCSLSSLLSSSSSELDSVCCREISTIKASCVNEAVDGRRGDALSEQDKHRGPSRGDDDDDDDDMNPMKSDNCCQSASISLANDDKETDTSSSSLSSFRPSSAGRNTLGAHSIKYESHSQPDYEMNATSGRQTSEHQWGRPRGLPETPARAQASERRNLRANNNNNNINTTLRHHKLRLPHQHHRRHNYHLHHRHHHLGWPAIGPTATAALLACLVATLITLTLTNSVEAVDCFKCSSRNGSNPACEDPFHNLNTTRVTTAILPDPSPSVIYHTPCHAGKKGRDGLFPASACIKLTGTFDTTGETLVVRHCALDSGTLTQDTELARMSHCGKFQFEGDLLKGWRPETNRGSGDACKPREATSCSRRWLQYQRPVIIDDPSTALVSRICEARLSRGQGGGASG